MNITKALRVFDFNPLLATVSTEEEEEYSDNEEMIEEFLLDTSSSDA